MSENIWPTIHAERRALADDLAGLDEQQWATPSLCAEWTVHDVTAHLVSLAKLTPPGFVVRFARSGFRFDQYTARQVALEGRGGPQTTLAAFTSTLDRTSAPPGPKDTWLGEVFVHGEDIRRPLGLTRDYPAHEVARALRFYARSDAIIGGKSRVAGLTLQATDVDCTIGSGPHVQGPAIALLLAASGRQVTLTELTGDGVAVLSRRA